MEIESVTNPVEAPAEAEVATEESTTAESEALETDLTDEVEGEGQEDEFEEVEINGNRYKVPKEIAPAIMKNADYTQKTQTLAEERRQWEMHLASERERIQREAEVSEAIQDDIAQYRAVEARLKSLQNVNAYALPPADQQRYILELNQLQMARGELGGRINSRKSELEAEREHHIATAISQAVETLNKPDERLGWPGKYDETMRTSLTGFARELGFTDAEVSRETRPHAVKLLHLAKIGLETLKKQQAASRPAKTEAKPVPQVGQSRATAITNPDRLSMDEWVKYERKRMAKAQGR
jgi:hypothetical protein